MLHKFTELISKVGETERVIVEKVIREALPTISLCCSIFFHHPYAATGFFENYFPVAEYQKWPSGSRSIPNTASEGVQVAYEAKRLVLSSSKPELEAESRLP